MRFRILFVQRCALALVLFAGLRGDAVTGRHPPRRRPARDGDSRSRFPGRGWAMPRRSSIISRDHDASRSRKSTTTTSRQRSRSPRTARSGLHDLRVRTATGISELRTFSVGALKEITEVEPNNDFAGPAGHSDERDGDRRRRQ